jgi:isopentenyl-diphosphate delta-isomerase
LCGSDFALLLRDGGVVPRCRWLRVEALVFAGIFAPEPKGLRAARQRFGPGGPAARACQRVNWALCSRKMGDISSRKIDHLDLATSGDVGFKVTTTLFECVRLVHDSLPELSVASLDRSCRVLGKTLRAPLFIAGMTGGTDRARRINRELASIAEERGYAFGVGSQRAMLKSGDAKQSYEVRDVAPTALLLSNIGGVQAASMTTDAVRELVDALGADALCVHLNPAQEIVQEEGDRDFRGVLDALSRL